MGQASSASTKEYPSPLVHREDSVRVEEAEASENPSRPDSWSMHQLSETLLHCCLSLSRTSLTLTLVVLSAIAPTKLHTP